MKKKTQFIIGALAAFNVVAVALGATGDPGDIFVSQRLPNPLPNIYRIPPSGVAATFVDGLAQVTGLAFDNAGNLFAADYINHMIWKFRAHGGAIVFATNVGTGSRGPLGLACDSVGDVFVVIDDGQIYKFAPDGTRSLFAGAPAFALAFDSAGFLYVSEPTAFPSRIDKYAPDGTRTTFAQDAFLVPTYMAFDSADNLFVRGFASGASVIYKFTPNGTRSTFSTTSLTGGLTCDSAGNVYGASFNIVYKFTPAGTRSLFANILDPHIRPDLGFMTIHPPGPPGSTPPPHPTPPPRQSPPPRS